MERYLEAVIPQLILVIININLIWESSGWSVIYIQRVL